MSKSSKSSAALSRDFGRWLRQQRRANGVSQKIVAEKTGITVTQLSRIENGRSSTRRDTVIHLARIIGIDERDALRHFAPESFPQFPSELENITFSEFTKQELKEIADFINFKLSQKRAAKEGKIDKITDKPPKDSGEVQPYQVEDGRLTSSTEKEKKEHTNQKPPE